MALLGCRYLEFSESARKFSVAGHREGMLSGESYRLIVKP